MVENKYYIPFNEVSNIANRIHVCLQAFSVFQIADFRRKYKHTDAIIVILTTFRALDVTIDQANSLPQW